MHRFGAEVQRAIVAARAAGAKVSIFDDRGCLLWFCGDWEKQVGSMDQWREALGSGWLEFVHPHDLQAVEEWIAAGDRSEVRFRSIGPAGGGWQVVYLKKRRVGLYWLAVGDQRAAAADETNDATGIIFGTLLAALPWLEHWSGRTVADIDARRPAH